MAVPTSYKRAKAMVNLDWTREPPPKTLTPYQEYIRGIDWSKTAFGSRHSWCRELRQTVLFMMAEVDPVVLHWGDSHAIIYNEAYIPLVGKKHPHMLGMSSFDAFPDFWSYFDNVIREQRLDGQTRVGEASMLFMERHGFLEETYFDWKLIPVIGEDGTMLGSYGRPSESSSDVLQARRVACIQSLTQQISTTNSFDELWKRSIEGLSQNDKDIPLAMLYSIHQPHLAAASLPRTSTFCKLEATLGIPEGHRCAEARLDLQNSSFDLTTPMREAHDRGSIQIVRLADVGCEHMFIDIMWRGFGIPVTELAVLPIRASESIAAILILGINPRLRFTTTYQDFVQNIADVIFPQVLKLKLAEEIKSRERNTRYGLSEFQKSEMRFARFAERSPLGLTLTDSDGKVTYANEAWFNFCGLPPDEHEYSSWIDTVYDEDIPVVNEWWHKVTQLKESGTFQVRSKQPYVSGNMSLPYRTGIVAIYPDLDDHGNVANVMGLVTDISELKWNEAQLHLRQKGIEDSESKYRNFAEHAPIGVIRTDAQGYVQFANDTWRSFYNFEKDHKFTEAQPWLSSLNKEDVPLAIKFFEDTCKNRGSKSVEVRMNRRKTSMTAHQTPPGDFWLLSSGFVESNADGSINNVVFWVTDITDQKAAERILTDKMEEAIRTKNTQERFVDMISHEIRNPLSAILHCGEEVIDAMKACLVSLESFARPEGSYDDGQSMRPLVVNNVTSALDAANTILYCTQHQKQIVDDVLTLSKLDADLLVVSPIPVQPLELVKTALKIFEPELKASATELAVEPGSSLQELGIDWIMLDPNRFLQIVINLVTNAIKFTRNSKTRRIVISVTARNDKPPRQDKGVIYVPRRASAKDVASEALDDGVNHASSEKLYLCFSVADSGKGLTELERTVLFNRFAQASPKTHIEYGGSGLGLFISRQITEMLGGEIGVGSEPGKGATFAFYVLTRPAIPLNRDARGTEPISIYPTTGITSMPGSWVTDHADDPQHTTANEDPRTVLSTPNSANHKRRVLVVEDNLINQKVLCKQLRNRGFLVEAANHGGEALDALRKTIPEDNKESSCWFEVILCDIEMPVMDGIECVTRIRELEKDGVFKAHIPIIGVTANVRSKQVNAAIEAGMDGVTTKPYRIDDLIAHIDRVSGQVKTSTEKAGS